MSRMAACAAIGCNAGKRQTAPNGLQYKLAEDVSSCSLSEPGRRRGHGVHSNVLTGLENLQRDRTETAQNAVVPDHV